MSAVQLRNVCFSVAGHICPHLKYSTITIHMYLIHIIIYHDINMGQKELHNVMQLYRSLCIFYETYENCTYRNHFCH